MAQHPENDPSGVSLSNKFHLVHWRLWTRVQN